ncbi:hypothetical protein [Roseibium sp. LAB1]
MQKDDLISRVAIFPKFVNENIFDFEQFFNFQSNDDRSMYISSVVSKFIMRCEDRIHEYGSSVAQSANRRLISQFGEHVPSEKVNYYVGYYDIRYCDAISPDLMYYSMQIKWRPENDCDAHFQIEMVQKPNCLGSKREKRNDRTIGVHSLSKALRGPTKAPFPIDSSPAKILDLLPDTPNGV